MRWQKTSRDWGLCFFVTSKLPEGDVPEWGSGSRGKGGGGSGEVCWGKARFGKGGGGSQGRWEVLFRGSLKNCPVLNRQQVRKSVLSMLGREMRVGLPFLSVLGREVQIGVELFELFDVSGLELRPFELEGRGQTVVVDVETLEQLVELKFNVDSRDLFEALQFASVFLHVGEHPLFDFLPDVLRFTALLERRNPLGSGWRGGAVEFVLKNVGHNAKSIRNDNGDNLGLETVTVDPDLVDGCRLGVGILDLLDGNVFSLREFENVLLPVDDRKRAVGVDATNVSSAEPAVLGQNLFRLLGHFVVTLEDDRSPDLDFTAGGVVFLLVDSLLVCACVVHLRDVRKTDLTGDRWGPVVSDGGVGEGRDTTRSSGLSQTVTLHHRRVGHELDELHEISGHRGGSRDGDLHLVESHLCGDTLPDDLVVESRSFVVADVNRASLGRILREFLLEEGASLDASPEFLVELSVDARDTDEKRGLNEAEVFGQLFDVALGEGNGKPHVDA